MKRTSQNDTTPMCLQSVAICPLLMKLFVFRSIHCVPLLELSVQHTFFNVTQKKGFTLYKDRNSFHIMSFTNVCYA